MFITKTTSLQAKTLLLKYKNGQSISNDTINTQVQMNKTTAGVKNSKKQVKCTSTVANGNKLKVPQ